MFTYLGKTSLHFDVFMWLSSVHWAKNVWRLVASSFSMSTSNLVRCLITEHFAVQPQETDFMNSFMASPKALSFLFALCDLCHVDAQTSGFVGLGTNAFPGLCVHYLCVPCCVC